VTRFGTDDVDGLLMIFRSFLMEQKQFGYSVRFGPEARLAVRLPGIARRGMNLGTTGHRCS
jgi:hypothetical protein